MAHSVFTELVWPPVTRGDIAHVARLLRAGHISYNRSDTEIRRLESKFKQFLGRKHCLAVNSGTTALYLAYLSLGIKPGDEVIVPTYTFPATVMPLLHTDATMVFVDTEKDGVGPDFNMLRTLITPRTRAIVVSHMDGYPVDCDRMGGIIAGRNIQIIEDCAQAIGARIRGRTVGSLGDVSAFSFQQKKLLAGGEGGLIATDSDETYERCVLLSYLQCRSESDVHCAELRPFIYTGAGFNFRIHPLAAALVNRQLERLPGLLRRKHHDYERIREKLVSLPGISAPIAARDSEVVHFNLKLLVSPAIVGQVGLSRYVQALQSQGVPVDRAATRPLHSAPALLSPASLRRALFIKSQARVRVSVRQEWNADGFTARALRLSGFLKTDSKTADRLYKAFRRAHQVLSLPA